MVLKTERKESLPDHFKFVWKKSIIYDKKINNAYKRFECTFFSFDIIPCFTLVRNTNETQILEINFFDASQNDIFVDLNS